MNGSTNAHLFAPGKLIWMGEYAVLDGAPSIVQAVDRGLHLDFVAGPSPMAFALLSLPYGTVAGVDFSGTLAFSSAP